LSNGLIGTVTEDNLTIPVGGTVTYTLTLTNPTTQPITFQTVKRDAGPSGGVGDALTVKDAKGSVTFPQGSFGQVVTYGPTTTLAPKTSMSGTLAVGGSKDLGQFSAAGPYFASATFTVLTPTGTPASGTTLPLEVDVQ
jgi:uncharacterized repeat protein (TIGR01451 family)